VKNISLAGNDEVLFVLNESGIDMKLQGRAVDEANGVERVGA